MCSEARAQSSASRFTAGAFGLSIQASFGFHLWIFKQAGQRSGISNFGSIVSNTTVSVLSPVGTAIPIIGQRIMILGTKSPYETRPLLPVQKADMQKPSRVAPIKMPTIRSDKNIRCTDMDLGR